jgi:hypothetical protein
MFSRCLCRKRKAAELNDEGGKDDEKEAEEVLAGLCSPITVIMDEARRMLPFLQPEVLGLIEGYSVTVMVHSEDLPGVEQLVDAFARTKLQKIPFTPASVNRGCLVPRSKQILPFDVKCIRSLHRVNLQNDGLLEVATEEKSDWSCAALSDWAEETHIGSSTTLSLRSTSSDFSSCFLLYDKRRKAARQVSFHRPGAVRVMDDAAWASHPRFAWIAQGSVFVATIVIGRRLACIDLAFLGKFEEDSQLLPSPIRSTVAVVHANADKTSRVISLVNVETGEIMPDFFSGSSNAYILKHIQLLKYYSFHRRSCLAKDSQRGYILDFDSRCIQPFTLPVAEQHVLNIVWH